MHHGQIPLKRHTIVHGFSKAHQQVTGLVIGGDERNVLILISEDDDLAVCHPHDVQTVLPIDQTPHQAALVASWLGDS